MCVCVCVCVCVCSNDVQWAWKRLFLVAGGLQCSLLCCELCLLSGSPVVPGGAGFDRTVSVLPTLAVS